MESTVPQAVTEDKSQLNDADAITTQVLSQVTLMISIFVQEPL